jgi:hypothetical protein
MTSRIRTAPERAAIREALAHGPLPIRSLASAIKRTRQETESLVRDMRRKGELERRRDRELGLFVWGLPGRAGEPVPEHARKPVVSVFVTFERPMPKPFVREPTKPSVGVVPGWMIKPEKPPARRAG